MEIETTVNIDMDDLANNLEDNIREIAQDQMNNNEPCFQNDDDVMTMIEDAGYLDADDVQQLINESMMDVADNTDTVNEITTEYRDLRLECQDMRNEVEKLRRSMRILLEEREASLKKRMIRAYNGGSRAVSNAIRKVQNAWPTKKD